MRFSAANGCIELGGAEIRRSKFLSLVRQQLDNLVVFSAPGFWSVLVFVDNCDATLKMIKDDHEYDDIEPAAKLLAKHIRQECLTVKTSHTALKSLN